MCWELLGTAEGNLEDLTILVLYYNISRMQVYRIVCMLKFLLLYLVKS